MLNLFLAAMLMVSGTSTMELKAAESNITGSTTANSDIYNSEVSPYIYNNVSSTAADHQVRGKVLDRQDDTPMQYVNVAITTKEGGRFVKGSITDVNGNFGIDDLSDGDYIITISFVGYKDFVREFTISPDNRQVSYPAIFLKSDAKMLNEVTVTGQKSTMKLEVDRKVFDVSQMISSAGEAASDILRDIPSVDVDNDGNISLRGNSSVEVWINGKASGLTSDNRSQILEQLPAESIDHIEVIDNPSAKFSAEGSAGIINIVLKKDRKAGYYGSVQAGVDTRGGARSSVNFNYNSSLIDFYVNVGYRHRKNTGRAESDQTYLLTNGYQRYNTRENQNGNGLFTRAGMTLHATKHDDFSLNMMMMPGEFKSTSLTPYHYGTIGNAEDTYQLYRSTHSKMKMRMLHGEFNYHHNFNEKGTHNLDFTFSGDKWSGDNDNIYQDSTTWMDGSRPSTYDYQYRPMDMNSHSFEVKLDYENAFSENAKLQAGYQGNFSHENTPQISWIDRANWDGHAQVLDTAYFNRFIYDNDIHALYLQSQFKIGHFGIQAGLRGEYWRVNTKSYDYYQEYDASLREKPFKKDYFQLFPSIFLSYEFPHDQQLQLNYTRRLRRPWGGQLNSFRDTRDATTVSFGNPLLTPEYSNSFSLNYLKTWTEHSLLVSAYYRPTTDVMQRITYQHPGDGMMYSTTFNVAKNQSSGMELTLKNHLFRILDLTTNANAYYYKLDGWSYDIDGQTVTGEGREQFSWNGRIQAALILPYDISIQTSVRYNSRQSMAQGYRKSNTTMDFGLRKNFFNKALTLSINCRDVLNSRKWETVTNTDTFTRYQKNRRGGRKVNFTLTWNFGNNKAKKKPEMQHGDDDSTPMDSYSGGGEN